MTKIHIVRSEEASLAQTVVESYGVKYVDVKRYAKLVEAVNKKIDSIPAIFDKVQAKVRELQMLPEYENVDIRDILGFSGRNTYSYLANPAAAAFDNPTIPGFDHNFNIPEIKDAVMSSMRLTAPKWYEKIYNFITSDFDTKPLAYLDTKSTEEKIARAIGRAIQSPSAIRDWPKDLDERVAALLEKINILYRSAPSSGAPNVNIVPLVKQMAGLAKTVYDANLMIDSIGRRQEAVVEEFNVAFKASYGLSSKESADEGESDGEPSYESIASNLMTGKQVSALTRSIETSVRVRTRNANIYSTKGSKVWDQVTFLADNGVLDNKEMKLFAKYDGYVRSGKTMRKSKQWTTDNKDYETDKLIDDFALSIVKKYGRGNPVIAKAAALVKKNLNVKAMQLLASKPKMSRGFWSSYEREWNDLSKKRKSAWDEANNAKNKMVKIAMDWAKKQNPGFDEKLRDNLIELLPEPLKWVPTVRERGFSIDDVDFEAVSKLA